MAYLHTITIILLVGVFEYSQAQNDVGAIVSETVLTALSKIFAPKCSRNRNPNALQEILASANDVGLCASSKMPPSNREVDIIEHICKSFRPIEYDCLQAFTMKLQPCLVEQENFVGDFIMAARRANFDYICKNDGNNLRDLDSFDVGSCQLLQMDIFSKCVQTSKLVDSFSKNDTVVTKVQLCSDLTDLVTCLSNGTKQRCQRSPSVAEYLALAYKTYLDPCNSTSTI